MSGPYKCFINLNTGKRNVSEDVNYRISILAVIIYNVLDVLNVNRSEIITTALSNELWLFRRTFTAR